MPQTIIGRSGLIDVDYVAGMLRGLAPPHIDRDNVNWWATAERAIEMAKNEAAKNGGSMAFGGTDVVADIDWAMSERIALMRAAERSRH